MGNGEAVFVLAAEAVIDAAFELGGAQQPVGLGHSTLAVYPLGFDGVEPGALLRQQARQDADAPTTPLDAPVMLLYPLAHRPAYVPGGVIPHQQQCSLPQRCELGATPLEVPARQLTHRPLIREPQPHPLLYQAVRPPQV